MVYDNLISQLRAFCIVRFEHYLKKREDTPNVQAFVVKGNPGHPFIDLIRKYNLSSSEQLLLSIALMPYLDPDFYSGIVQRVLPQGGDLPIFGCVKGKHHRGFLPTGETFLFLFGGVDVQQRLTALALIKDSELLRQGVLELRSVEKGEPEMSGRLSISTEVVDLLLTGKEGLPKFGSDFPAQKIDTEEAWDDLVLTEDVLDQLEELKTWLTYNDRLKEEWGMHKKFKPGYRVLFYGPPGTGKTLTAKLLGKYTDRAVYRIDLSIIVSKYIGETEKNLEKLFSKAENKNWILFFDEADALFGKRTEVSDSHDRYANQEVSYLLQRVESFSGLVVLSSNFKSNMDEAFIRRFNSIIKFPFPSSTMRERLWRSSFPAQVEFDADVDFSRIAATYKLAGGSINNAVHLTLLNTMREHTNKVSLESLLHAIKREVEKEGKVFDAFPSRRLSTSNENSLP